MAVLDISPIQEYKSGVVGTDADTGKPTGGWGTTRYDFHFPIISTADIEIRFDGGKITNAGDYSYTVTRVGDKGGYVTFGKVPTVADPTLRILQIRRTTPYTRHTEYTDNGDLLAKTINDDFDRLWLCLQEQRASADASLSRPVGTTSWDALDFPIINLKDGVHDNDAATVGQVKKFTQSAEASATKSATSATQSAGSATASATAQAKAETAQKAAEAAAQTASTQRGLAQSAAAQAANDATAAAQTQIKPFVDQAEGFKNQAATLKSQAEAAATTAGIDAATEANKRIQPSITAAEAAKTAAQTAANKAATDASAQAQALIAPQAQIATNAAATATAQAQEATRQAALAAASASLAGQKATAATDQATAAKKSADDAAAAKTAAEAAKNTTAQAAAAAATTAATAASLKNAQDAATAQAQAEAAKTQAQGSAVIASTAKTGAETAKTAAEAALATLKSSIDADRGSVTQNIYAPDASQTDGRGMRLSMSKTAGLNAWGFYGRDNKPVPIDAAMFPAAISLRNVTSVPAVTAGTNGGQLLLALNDGTATADVASASLRVVKLKNGDGTHSARALLSVSDFDTAGVGERNSILSFESTGNLSITGNLRAAAGAFVGGPTSGEIITVQPDSAAKSCYIRFRDSAAQPMAWIGYDTPSAPGKFTISSTAGGSRIDLMPDGKINYLAKAGQGHNFNEDVGFSGPINCTNGAHMRGDGAPLNLYGATNTSSLAINGNATDGKSQRWQLGITRSDQPRQLSLVNSATGCGLDFYSDGHTELGVKVGSAVKKFILNVSGTTTFPNGGSVSATGTWANSDARLKENIQPAAAAVNAGDRIKQIVLRSYRWKESGIEVTRGVVAQELQQIDPAYVEENENTGHLMYSEAAIVMDLIGAVQELQREVAALKASK